MRVLSHPVARFVAAGAVLLAGMAVLTSVLVGRAAEAEALSDARLVTDILARDVVEPAIPAGLAAGDAGAADRFDRAVGALLVSGDVRRVKVWSASGQVVYSDATRLIGERFALDEEEREVLREGGTDAELSDLDKPENRFERGAGPSVEVYTRVAGGDGEPMLFEAYYSVDDIEQRKQQVFEPFRRIAVGALGVMMALAVPVIWILARQLTRAAEDRERLLRGSVDASAAERRRIARDLHDGVVQDLAGTAFSVAALAREEETALATRSSLEVVSASLRSSLRALRSLLVEIHPRDLSATGLRAALEDLTAPATAAGLRTEVHVVGVAGASDQAVALVWRAAQEAVRNTVRHASAANLEIRVDGTGGPLHLEVRDDGRGFDPEDQARPGSFGMRGLQSLVRDSGGRVDVRSAPGAGTTVTVEVPR